jgi:RNA polymerase primary sigma factor
LAQRGRLASTASPLPADKELELVVATESGDRIACRKLVESFLPAIRGIAHRFDVGGQVQRTELMQEGVAGLLLAAKRYDARLRTPFWSYASFWVRKAMQELVAEVTRPAALSDRAVRRLAQLSAARQAHLKASGAEPTRSELATATGFTRSQVDSLLAIDRTARSLDERLLARDATATTVGETIADPGAEYEYERVLDEMEVRDLADELDERERLILWGHYGLGQPPQTLSNIGAALGLTAERVRQIEAEALEKLRAAAAEPSGRRGQEI